MAGGLRTTRAHKMSRHIECTPCTNEQGSGNIGKITRYVWRQFRVGAVICIGFISADKLLLETVLVILWRDNPLALALIQCTGRIYVNMRNHLAHPLRLHLEVFCGKYTRRSNAWHCVPWINWKISVIFLTTLSDGCIINPNDAIGCNWKWDSTCPYNSSES